MKARNKILNSVKVAIASCCLFMLFATTSYSQNITAFSFGSIGNIGDKKPSFSGTINFQNIACISMSSGLPALMPTNKGMFINYCEVQIPISALLLELTASPNPMNTYANIKLAVPLKIINDEQVLIRIFNSYGNVVNEFTTMLSNLNMGYQLQFTNPMNNGIYFLKATSQTSIFKPITLIKQK